MKLCNQIIESSSEEIKNMTALQLSFRKNMELEDYKNLKFSERRELDQKAYAKYYDEHWDISNDQCLGTLTFNSFYGTEIHKKYLRIFLRKLKLEQIKNSQHC